MIKNYIYFAEETKESAMRLVKKHLKQGYKAVYETDCIIVTK